MGQSPGPALYWANRMDARVDSLIGEGSVATGGSRMRLPVGGHAAARLALGLLLCVLLGWAGYRLALPGNIERQQHANAQRLSFYAASFESLVTKHEYLPRLVGLERDVIAALEHPGDAARAAAANAYLEAVQGRTGLAAIYVMDMTGHTLASSNWRTPHSFVGQNYSFRPYFQEAAAGGLGRFYAIGATTGEPGYFLAAPVRAGGRIIGVAAIKLGLDEFEAALSRSGEHLLVADATGVIFLSAYPPWRYRTLIALDGPTRERLEAARQYAGVPLTPVDEKQAVRLVDEPQLVELRLPAPGEAGSPLQRRQYLVQSQTAGPDGVRLVLLAGTAEARRAAAGVGAAAGFAGAFLFVGINFLYQRRRRLEERLAARRALQRAYEELEARIAERTGELVQANERLQEKVAALKQTETILRETQDTAVQAGKLAVLGQMAAGVTHELNQPLAALTTLSGNSVKLMELGHGEEVRENLRMMAQLAQRMGRIVGQLKAFARKSPVHIEPIVVADAIGNALLLVEARRREAGVAVEVLQPEPSLRVMADSVRLEQVLVNLMRNGIEAMEAGGERRLSLRVARDGAQVQVAVRDHGPGIAQEAMQHLFEPFYTTKPAGKGLGLGLAISLAIVRSFGGELSAANAPDGGAEFLVTLTAA